MLKFKHIFCLFFVVITNVSVGQFVTIPDANFRTWLNNNGYASCMSGNMLDTTCSAVTNATIIDCTSMSISNLTGIEYFDSLIKLVCRLNVLNVLPPLKAPLQHLDCAYNSIDSLPQIPSTLNYLIVDQNDLTSLPPLPSGLGYLYCEGNNISSLPPLPSGLKTLKCGFNPLYNLPTLPQTLNHLDCEANSLNSVPPLPAGLIILVCGKNNIDSLPPLPNELIVLHCNENPISNLFTLPDSLRSFDCANCGLTSLPNLPANLLQLECSDNLLTSLPAPLPTTLAYLRCNRNSLVSLPTLNNQLKELRCSNNFLTNIPLLPSVLEILYCDSTLITSLPILPAGLKDLSCKYDNISFLPDLPDSLNTLLITNCPITCLPEIYKIKYFDWIGTGLTCIPNYIQCITSIPDISSLGLCQPSTNCPLNWNISGNVFNDININCIDDSEPGLKNIAVKLDSAGVTLQQVLTDVYGNFSFHTYYGTYEVIIDTMGLPFDVFCPLNFSYTSVITLAAPQDSLANFGMQCQAGYDLNAAGISTDEYLRPGGTPSFFLIAGEASVMHGTVCTSPLPGTVQVVISGPAIYVGPAPGAQTPSLVNGDTLIWNVNDFALSDPMNDYNVEVYIPTTATLGDLVCMDLSVMPDSSDNFPANNISSMCFPIMNSLDPNIKIMSPDGAIDTSQHWFTFTLFFQNTGNAPAEDIYLLDTLSNNLDPTTFVFQSSSHDVITQMLPGNVLRFNFSNIMLPDSTSDEPNSHGSVQFRVKRKPGLPFGTTISNTAYIYFDYNPAIITNTVSAVLTNMIGLGEQSMSSLKLFPNPADETIYIQLENSGILSIELFDLPGRLVYQNQSTNLAKNFALDVSHLHSGIYLVCITISNETFTRIVQIQ